jgi:hypothetical protein
MRGGRYMYIKTTTKMPPQKYQEKDKESAVKCSGPVVDLS